MTKEDMKDLDSNNPLQTVDYSLTPEEQAESDERLEEGQELLTQTEEESIKAKRIADEKSIELKESGIEKINSNYKLYTDWIKKGIDDIDGLEIDGFKISTENVITEIYAKRDFITFITDLIGTTRNYLIREEVYRFISTTINGNKVRCVIGENGKIYFEYDIEFNKQLENDPKKYIKDSYITKKRIKVNTPNTDLSNMGDDGPLNHFND